VGADCCAPGGVTRCGHVVEGVEILDVGNRGEANRADVVRHVTSLFVGDRLRSRTTHGVGSLTAQGLG
jgi:hypothetical protein